VQPLRSSSLSNSESCITTRVRPEQLPQSETAWSLTRRVAISSVTNFTRVLQQWKIWIATNGPILAGLSVDATWDDAASTQGKLDNFQPDTARGGHAICVVGYTPNRFIIRNSWGPTWGDKGFGYASPEYINDAFFAESYGVSL